MDYDLSRTVFYSVFITWTALNSIFYLILYKLSGESESIKKRNPKLLAISNISLLMLGLSFLSSTKILSEYTYTWSSPALVEPFIGISCTCFLLSYFLLALSLAVTLILSRIKLESENNTGSFKLDRSQWIAIWIFFWLKQPSWEEKLMNIIFRRKRSMSSKEIISSFQISEKSDSKSPDLPIPALSEIMTENVGESCTHSDICTQNSVKQMPERANVSLGKLGEKFECLTTDMIQSQILTQRFKFGDNSLKNLHALSNLNATLPDRLLVRFHVYLAIIFIPLIIISLFIFQKIEAFEISSTFGKWILGSLTFPFQWGIIFMLYTLRRENDSFGIKTELIGVVSTYLPSLLLFFLVELLRLDIFSNVRNIYGSIFIVLIMNVIVWILTTIPLTIRSILELRHDHPIKKFFAFYSPKSPHEKTENEMINYIIDGVKFKRFKASLAQDLCMENALFLEQLVHAHLVCKRPFSVFSQPAILLEDHKVDHLSSINNNSIISKLSLKMPFRTRLKSNESNISESQRTSISTNNPLTQPLITDVDKPAQDIKNETRIVQSIYKSFIKDGSPNELNLASAMKNSISKEVVASLKSQNINLSLSIMDPVKDEVVKMVYANNWIRFMEREKRQ